MSRSCGLFAFCVQHPTRCMEMKCSTKRANTRENQQPWLQNAAKAGLWHFIWLKLFTLIKFKCSEPLKTELLSLPPRSLSLHWPSLIAGAQTCTRVIFSKHIKGKKKSLPPATVTAGAINLVLSSSTTTDRAARQGTKDQALPPEVWCTSPGSAGSSGIHGDSSFSAQRKLIQHKRKERGSKIKCLLLWHRFFIRNCSTCKLQPKKF